MTLEQKGLKLLKDVVEVFDDLAEAVPKEKKEGVMDFACRLSGGEIALIEMQLAPHTACDLRALAYTAYAFCNQLKKGDKWKQLKKAVGISILGGGLRSDKVQRHWADTPSQCVRHYRFQEQLHKPSQYIDGIELIQYCLTNSAKNHNYTQLQQDWLKLLTNAHNMQETDVNKTIQTDQVRNIFDLVKISQMDKESKKAYEAEDLEYGAYSEYVLDAVRKERAEKERAIERERAEKEKAVLDAVEKERAKSMERFQTAIAMLKIGEDTLSVVEQTGLTANEVEDIRKTFLPAGN
jgi:predicted transposase/invertase (TIGR01784 family)